MGRSEKWKDMSRRELYRALGKAEARLERAREVSEYLMRHRNPIRDAQTFGFSTIVGLIEQLDAALRGEEE